ncbi:MAG: response regulator, partial [Bacteroidia bacterium]
MTNEKINILYVDDEPNNLVSFIANLRGFYNIYTATSAEEGKKILNTEEIHVIITDQRMPGITG